MKVSKLVVFLICQQADSVNYQFLKGRTKMEKDASIVKRVPKVLRQRKTKPGLSTATIATPKGVQTHIDPGLLLAVKPGEVVSTPYVRYVDTPGYQLDVSTIRKMKEQLEAREVLPPIPSETHVQAPHLSTIVSRKACDNTIAEVIQELKGVDFDTVVVRGVSGLLIGPLLAYLSKRELLVIRKGKDRTASDCRYEGHIALKRYIIADDLISTGSTCVQIVRAVKDISPDAKLVGIMLYSYCESVVFHSESSNAVKRIIDKAANPEWTCIR